MPLVCTVLIDVSHTPLSRAKSGSAEASYNKGSVADRVGAVNLGPNHSAPGLCASS